MTTSLGTHYTWLLVALPLAGAAILLFGGRRTDAWGHLLGCAAALAAFGVGAMLLADMLGRDGLERAIHQQVFTWIPAGGLQVDFGLQIDQLSMCFVLLISGVGSLIHIYSVGYMAEDPDRRRFFGYLNLFLASMLLLVVADNYVLLYVGWEGVGLASYLLIGFWYHKPSAATAAKKAFVMNRVGDAGLAVGMFLTFSTFGTLSYAGVFAGVPAASRAVLTAIGLLMLLGACAKSAQVPLQAWLGDAMEGSHPGVRADPRRHHGDRRSVFDCAVGPAVQPGAHRPTGGRHRRRGDAAVWGDHRLRQGRHQTCAGSLDH